MMQGPSGEHTVSLCCVLGEDTISTVPLSFQVYKWVLPYLTLGEGGTLILRWTRNPSRGGRGISLRHFMLQKPEYTDNIGNWALTDLVFYQHL